MTLSGGTLLGRFEILGELGAGGMGEVYRARDPQLGREVAIKILTDDVAPTRDRVRRLESEARALSMIRHPAIVPVFEFSEARLPDRDEPVRFLVMELVEGEPLSSSLPARFGLRTVLGWMADAADGVAAAHAAGIIHRDLKPSNIMIAKSRWAKILDFGLAKMARNEVPPAAETASIVGTPDYMSPEQITGGAIDTRSDVFAFGCTLHEVVSGAPPFRRGTRVDTLHAIAHDQPDPLPDRLPPELKRIVRKCLARSPEHRYQSMLDVATDLRTLAAEMLQDESQKRRHRRLFLAAAVAIVVVASMAAWMGWPRSQSTHPAAAPAVAVLLKMERLTNSGRVTHAAISPDGKYLAYSEREPDGVSLWVKHLKTGSVTRVVETQPMLLQQIAIPGEGDWIYYVTLRQPAGVEDVTRVPLLGGSPERVVEFIDGAALSEDGRRVAWIRFHAEVRDFVLGMTDLATRTERILTVEKPPKRIGAIAWRGENVTFVSGLRTDLSRTTMIEIDSVTGRKRTLFPFPEKLTISAMVWRRDGSEAIVSGRDTSLITARIAVEDLWALRTPDGRARKITTELDSYRKPTMTRDGEVVVALRVQTTSNLEIVDVARPREPRPLTQGIGNRHGVIGNLHWFPGGEIVFNTIDRGALVVNTIDSRGGAVRPLPELPNVAGGVTVSRDGSKIAYLRAEAGAQNIWVMDRATGQGRRVTSNEFVGFADFFPDGQHLAITTLGEEQRISKLNIVTGIRTRVTTAPTNSPKISPDGRLLLCEYRHEEQGKPLWRVGVVPLESPGRPLLFDVTPRHVRWHPSGDSFSYLEGSRKPNIWQQDLKGGRPRQVTFFETGEVFDHAWSPDGRFLVIARGDVVSDAVAIRMNR